MIGIECAWDDATASGFFSNVLDTILHLDWLCPEAAQLMLESTMASAVRQVERVTSERAFSENVYLHQNSKCIETVIQRVNICEE